MPEYTVRQGDSIISIAYRNGFFWETIWDHPDNAELKERREDPNVLYPGDVVFIPEKQEKEETCGTDQTHRFRRKGALEELRIVLKDEEGEPRANMSYLLTIDGSNINGTTDGDGLLVESILPDASQGRLIVLDEQGNELEEYELALGHLDPITEISGVQMRLTNLGYDCSSEEGGLGTRTQQAIERFQQAQDLETTGELDDTTRQKLKEVHGS